MRDCAKENEVTDRGVRIFYFPALETYYKTSVLFTRAIYAKARYYDIIHIHSLFQFTTLVTCYLARKAGRRYVMSPLGQLDPYLLKRHALRKKIYIEAIERSNLEHAHSVHCTSPLEMEWCKSLSEKINCSVIPLGIDLDEYRASVSLEEFWSICPEARSKKVVLFMGRITFKKGLDILVDGYARLASEKKDVHLVIAGPDNEGYGKVIQERIQKLGMVRKVTIIGMLEKLHKVAAMKSCAVFVLPSYSENFGLAPIEAMACGAPIVISDRVGIHNEVTKYNAGIVTQCDKDSVYRALRLIIDDDVRAKEMAKAGKAMVFAHYDMDSMADKMIAMYAEGRYQ